MKLPIPFLQSKKEDSDYYLSLIITDEKISAVVLQATNEVLKKVNTHEAFFEENVGDLTMDVLVNTADKAISRAEEVLPPNIQTHQTIFGVKENWVELETKKIKKEYLDMLKKVCDALDLKPLGFMVTTEAITHVMQDEEGTPLSAIFAEVTKRTVILSLFRGGKVLETVHHPILESIPVTVDTLLTHFSVPVLPARIVIFQSKPNEHTTQAFLHHKWSKSLPFLHIPHVTILPEGFDLRAVMIGAANQMGFSISEPAHESLAKVTPNEKDEEALLADDAAIQEQTPIEDTPEQHQEAALLAEEASEFGFVVDQDIDKLSDTNDLQDTTPDQDKLHIPEGDDELEDETLLRSSHSEPMVKKLLDRISKNKVLSSLKTSSFVTFFGKLTRNNSTLKIVIPIVAVVLLIIGIIFFYFYGMKATVELTVAPNMVDQKNTVTFAVDGENDFANNVVAAKSVSTTLNGQVATPATGKKDEGDKAKGTLTIYNTSPSTVTLQSGTQLTAGNGQVFTLDNTVEVASASGDIFSGTKPGTTDTTATAKTFGTDGNEPSGTKFAISGNDSVAGKNDNAFSGGTKKTVTVVSAEDLATLRGNIVKSVQAEAQQKLESQGSGDQTILPVMSAPSLQAQRFDKNVGDETAQVALNANIVFTGIAYDKNDLNDYAKTILQQKNSQGGGLDAKTLQATVGSVTIKTKNTASAPVMLEGGLMPNINEQDVISAVKDKSLGNAKSTLSNLPQVQQADIIFSPSIPILPSLFPRLPGQITVEIKTQ